ncbi:hypothetical protein BC829DRAFT_380279 [Chytridium lagenaria]|nr:hypothetical protein BC829DRAFT_380279 [Chytridium lagenaria]
MEPAPSPAQLPFSPASTVGQERQEKTPQAERKRLHGPRSTPLPPSDLMSPPPATFNTMRTVSSSISQESSASSSAVGTLKSQTSFDSRNTSSPGPNRRSQLMGPRPLGAAKPAISGVFNGSTLPKTESTELVPSVEPSMDVPPTPPTRRSRLATNTETEQLRTMLTSNDVLSVPVVTEAAEADESAKMP